LRADSSNRAPQSPHETSDGSSTVGVGFLSRVVLQGSWSRGRRLLRLSRRPEFLASDARPQLPWLRPRPKLLGLADLSEDPVDLRGVFRLRLAAVRPRERLRHELEPSRFIQLRSTISFGYCGDNTGGLKGMQREPTRPGVHELLRGVR
jgi:hypothetical protein